MSCLQHSGGMTSTLSSTLHYAIKRKRLTGQQPIQFDSEVRQALDRGCASQRHREADATALGDSHIRNLHDPLYRSDGVCVDGCSAGSFAGYRDALGIRHLSLDLHRYSPCAISCPQGSYCQPYSTIHQFITPKSPHR